MSWSFWTDHSLSGLLLDPILSLSVKGKQRLSESILSLSGEATHFLPSGFTSPGEGDLSCISESIPSLSGEATHFLHSGPRLSG